MKNVQNLTSNGELNFQENLFLIIFLCDGDMCYFTNDCLPKSQLITTTLLLVYSICYRLVLYVHWLAQYKGVIHIQRRTRSKYTQH